MKYKFEDENNFYKLDEDVINIIHTFLNEEDFNIDSLVKLRNLNQLAFDVVVVFMISMHVGSDPETIQDASDGTNLKGWKLSKVMHDLTNIENPLFSREGKAMWNYLSTLVKNETITKDINLLKVNPKYNLTYQVLVLVGPSAVGKSSSKKFLNQEEYQTVKITTTRVERSEEEHDEKIFVSEKKFQELKELGEFMATEEHDNTHYGISKNEMKLVFEKGKVPIIDCKREISMQLKQSPKFTTRVVGMIYKDIESAKESLQHRDPHNPQENARRLSLIDDDQRYVLDNSEKWNDIIKIKPPLGNSAEWTQYFKKQAKKII